MTLDVMVTLVMCLISFVFGAISMGAICYQKGFYNGHHEAMEYAKMAINTHYEKEIAQRLLKDFS